MNEAQALQVVECQGQRILTTAQIARAFDATEQQVRNNFNRNKDKYQEGTHYIRLVGQEKEAFLGKTQFEFNLLSTKPLYLWTEQGAFLHAKSLNTDRAWQAYALLVAEYYHLKRLVETQTATVQRPMNNLFYARAISHLKDGYWCIYGELQVYVKYYPALVRNGVPDESVAHYWIQHLKAHRTALTWTESASITIPTLTSAEPSGPTRTPMNGSLNFVPGCERSTSRFTCPNISSLASCQRRKSSRHFQGPRFDGLTPRSKRIRLRGTRKSAPVSIETYPFLSLGEQAFSWASCRIISRQAACQAGLSEHNKKEESSI